MEKFIKWQFARRLSYLCNQTINSIKKSLNTIAKAPLDNRGKHKNTLKHKKRKKRYLCIFHFKKDTNLIMPKKTTSKVYHPKNLILLISIKCTSCSIQITRYHMNFIGMCLIQNKIFHLANPGLVFEM